ncbi:MAG: 4Fe-4S dicluster domain-containing protein [Candidatus Aminicenantes bacterium]|nr:4Fe-4S dicluster domain-containing protein [Candidatus Aminicenantes bacterium]
MIQKKTSPLTTREILPPPLEDRRSFLKKIVVGGSTLMVGGWFSSFIRPQDKKKAPQYSMILVDFDRCTGCRTCETVCSQFNHQVTIDGESLKGLGNPFMANIRVYSFNPDVDVPIVCVMCKDNPCLAICPVEPDEMGRKALYRDPNTLAIRCNGSRCIACGSCADACRKHRVNAIIPNRKTNRPERMCTLCDGDPQCVKYCPYGALTHIKGGLDGKHYGLSADKIATELIRRWYGDIGETLRRTK